MVDHPFTEFCQDTDVANFKLECVKMFLRMSCYHGPNLRRKLEDILAFCKGRVTEIHPHSKDKEPSDIEHKMSMVLETSSFNFGSQLWL